MGDIFKAISEDIERCTHYEYIRGKRRDGSGKSIYDCEKCFPEEPRNRDENYDPNEV